ncbi:MAG: hypothetical protein ACRDRI_26225 [Pseudonocardiaceae bacterium]
MGEALQQVPGAAPLRRLVWAALVWAAAATQDFHRDLAATLRRQRENGLPHLALSAPAEQRDQPVGVRGGVGADPEISRRHWHSSPLRG